MEFLQNHWGPSPACFSYLSLSLQSMAIALDSGLINSQLHYHSNFITGFPICLIPLVYHAQSYLSNLHKGYSNFVSLLLMSYFITSETSLWSIIFALTTGRDFIKSLSFDASGFFLLIHISTWYFHDLRFLSVFFSLFFFHPSIPKF